MSQKARKSYDDDDVLNALNELKANKPLSTVSKKYGIPRTTLRTRYTGKYPIGTKMGPKTILNEQEENYLVQWILTVAKAGFPVTKEQLLDSVAVLVRKLKRQNTFTNGRPGRHWYERFLKRHPQISNKLTQNITSTRGQVTEAHIRGWFTEITNYLTENNLLHVANVRQRVYNADETAFFLNPKGKKALVAKGSKAFNLIGNDEKECLTTLITGENILV